MAEQNELESDSSLSLSKVIATNIVWNKSHPTRSYAGGHGHLSCLPDTVEVTLPDGVLAKAERAKPPMTPDDVIETYAYDFLSREYGCEVFSCSVWRQG